ncbi:syntaxin-12 [Stomoxys calcitrans]|uniref:t-SNARE coiled-coil homology domain-containing protein n=1 Tax=Stomoxys calcitrans TaxID=35570 RepID=A0A1I8P011_STOCA|nr:syntaxin-12 [Stomoxys calcitrans]XP_013114694.1 syntaxin-12 [Stomoxys calcitrans]XP_013114695.1 syntaxin-12 [Stomoxys calcitrans]
MSQNLNNTSSSHRDYGATSSTTANMIGSGGSSSSIPDVNFSGFSPTEFMSLSEDIGHNIQAINSSYKQLDKILQIIGTPRDQQSTRDKVHDIHTKANPRIEATSIDFQRLTAIVRRGDKQQKLQLEKLYNDFCTVVEKYSIIQKRIAVAMRQTYSQNQLAQMQEQQKPNDNERQMLLRRQMQVEQQEMQFEHDLLVDRERQIKQIEADILDVNSIMRTMSTLVQAQSEDVERIETSVETTAAEVELAREELAKAANHRQSYRRKILILLAIAVIIGLIVTGIIVSKLTS